MRALLRSRLKGLGIWTGKCSLVCSTESYVKDTNHFLSLLAGIGDIPDGALLCAVDVVGLYPSIPHDEGLEAMRRALNSRPHVR